MAGVDQLFALKPEPKPSRNALEQAKIVAHRGIHEPGGIVENTWAAFDLALEKKMWGIEFDIRWTEDEVPVVLHDADPYRVFPEFVSPSPERLPLSRMRHEDLVKGDPAIPHFEEMIHRYAGPLHLFIEIKEPLDTTVKKQKFKTLLRNLKPGADFHIMSLNLDLYKSVDFLPPACFLPVAEWNFKAYSQVALNSDWAGLTGHYLLLGNSILKRHRANKQKIGTGFVNSKNLLYRELNRGVDWIFTDRALSVKALQDEALNS